MREYILMYTPLAISFLMAITIHEYAHGMMAYWRGDDTAYMAGRLTLNPFAHLDLLGTIVLVLTQMIGWAKPVPVNFTKLKNFRRDTILVSAAGPGANFLLALVCAGVFKVLLLTQGWVEQNSNTGLTAWVLFREISIASVQLNLVLGFFNLVPIPPLDGSKILYSLLPQTMVLRLMRVEQWGMFLILFLLLPIFDHSSIFGTFFLPVISSAYAVLMG